MVHYKVAVVLKRFFSYPNVGILELAYKLFKIQIRYLSKKWKHMHIKLISCCYNATSLEPIDDYLVNDPETQTEQVDHEDILNDSKVSVSPMPITVTQDNLEYMTALSSLNFSDEQDIDAFCQRFGEDRQRFFGLGIKDYGHWLRVGIGYW